MNKKINEKDFKVAKMESFSYLFNVFALRRVGNLITLGDLSIVIVLFVTFTYVIVIFSIFLVQTN